MSTQENTSSSGNTEKREIVFNQLYDRQIFCDIETTGLNYRNGEKVVEVAAIEYFRGKPTGKTCHLYFNPEMDMPQEAYDVHGLSTEFLKDKPIFEETCRQFKEFIEGDGSSKVEILLHNGDRFDIPFLDYEFMLAQVDPIRTWKIAKITDTLKVARAHKVSKKNDLNSLCEKYGVSTAKRNYHGALIDCELLADMWYRMTENFVFEPDRSFRQEPIVRISPQKASMLPEPVISPKEIKLNIDFYTANKNPEKVTEFKEILGKISPEISTKEDTRQEPPKSVDEFFPAPSTARLRSKF